MLICCRRQLGPIIYIFVVVDNTTLLVVIERNRACLFYSLASCSSTRRGRMTLHGRTLGLKSSNNDAFQYIQRRTRLDRIICSLAVSFMAAR